MGFFFLLNKEFSPKTYKNNDLAYKQIIPTVKAQQISIENMFWYSISGSRFNINLFNMNSL